MERQFNQLTELGLLKYNKGASNSKIRLNPNKHPEIVFVIANHNPRSRILKELLEKPEIQKFGQSSLFDLKFFIASFAGYGLHSSCMRSLQDFKLLVNNTE